MFYVQSVFHMMRGEFLQAMGLMSNLFCLSQIWFREPDWLTRVYALVAGWISIRGIELVVLNTPDDYQDYDRIWQWMDTIHRYWRAVDTSEYLSVTNTEDMRQWALRHQALDAKYVLLRMVSAIRRSQLETGSFEIPDTAQWERFGFGDRPHDPFSDRGTPLRYRIEGDPRTIVYYSIGADGVDDDGLIEAVPTSDVPYSYGDIVTRIPEGRQFPFPVEGVRANSADEILEQFPNGLPLDLFTGEPLMVSRSKLVTIFSPGPETSPLSWQPLGTAYVPTITYDPTNGVGSKGDLFYSIPPRRK